MRPTSSLSALAVLAALLPAAHAGERPVSRKEVPAAVLASFQKAYPRAKALRFTRDDGEGRQVFEIESLDGRVRRDLSYLPDGTLEEAEEAIAPSALPKAVQRAIQAGHPGAHVLRAERDTRGERVTYEVVLSVHGARKELTFDPEGKVVQG